MSMWSLQYALDLCTKIEKICPDYGCHVALTGGLLYKGGLRKDCDILFYRIRQCDDIDIDGLWLALDKIGVKKTSGAGWCVKATWEGRNMDCFFPEEPGDGDSYSTLEDNTVEVEEKAKPVLLICDKSTS